MISIELIQDQFAKLNLFPTEMIVDRSIRSVLFVAVVFIEKQILNEKKKKIFPLVSLAKYFF